MDTKKESAKVLAGATVVIILAYIISVYIRPQDLTQASLTQVTATPTPNPGNTPTPSPDSNPTPTGSPPASPTASPAQSGKYSNTVSYFVHRFNEQIVVTLTIQNRIIQAVSVSDSKSNPESAAYQTSFENSINDLVVGKNISQVDLASVGGASFTTAAFMEAVNKIKNSI